MRHSLLLIIIHILDVIRMGTTAPSFHIWETSFKNGILEISLAKAEDTKVESDANKNVWQALVSRDESPRSNEAAQLASKIGSAATAATVTTAVKSSVEQQRLTGGIDKMLVNSNDQMLKQETDGKISSFGDAFVKRSIATRAEAEDKTRNEVAKNKENTEYSAINRKFRTTEANKSQPSIVAKKPEAQNVPKITEPSKVVKAAEPFKPTKASEPTKVVKAVDPIKEVKAAKPAKVVKAAEPTKEVKGLELHKVIITPAPLLASKTPENATGTNNISEHVTMNNNISEPVTVANKISEPVTVASLISEPFAVATNISEPVTMATKISEPVTVATSISESSTVATKISEPVTVASPISVVPSNTPPVNNFTNTIQFHDKDIQRIEDIKKIAAMINEWKTKDDLIAMNKSNSVESKDNEKTQTLNQDEEESEEGEEESAQEESALEESDINDKAETAALQENDNDNDEAKKEESTALQENDNNNDETKNDEDQDMDMADDSIEVRKFFEGDEAEEDQGGREGDQKATSLKVKKADDMEEEETEKSLKEKDVDEKEQEDSDEEEESECEKKTNDDGQGVKSKKEIRFFSRKKQKDDDDNDDEDTSKCEDDCDQKYDDKKEETLTEPKLSPSDESAQLMLLKTINAEILQLEAIKKKTLSEINDKIKPGETGSKKLCEEPLEQDLLYVNIYKDSQTSAGDVAGTTALAPPSVSLPAATAPTSAVTAAIAPAAVPAAAPVPVAAVQPGVVLAAAAPGVPIPVALAPPVPVAPSAIPVVAAAPTPAAVPAPALLPATAPAPAAVQTAPSIAPAPAATAAPAPAPAPVQTAPTTAQATQAATHTVAETSSAFGNSKSFHRKSSNSGKNIAIFDGLLKVDQTKYKNNTIPNKNKCQNPQISDQEPTKLDQKLTSDKTSLNKLSGGAKLGQPERKRLRQAVYDKLISAKSHVHAPHLVDSLGPTGIRSETKDSNSPTSSVKAKKKRKHNKIQNQEVYIEQSDQKVQVIPYDFNPYNPYNTMVSYDSNLDYRNQYNKIGKVDIIHNRPMGENTGVDYSHSQTIDGCQTSNNGMQTNSQSENAVNTGTNSGSGQACGSPNSGSQTNTMPDDGNHGNLDNNKSINNTQNSPCVVKSEIFNALDLMSVNCNKMSSNSNNGMQNDFQRPYEDRTTTPNTPEQISCNSNSMSQTSTTPNTPEQISCNTNSMSQTSTTPSTPEQLACNSNSMSQTSTTPNTPEQISCNSNSMSQTSNNGIQTDFPKPFEAKTYNTPDQNAGNFNNGSSTCNNGIQTDFQAEKIDNTLQKPGVGASIGIDNNQGPICGSHIHPPVQVACKNQTDFDNMNQIDDFMATEKPPTAVTCSINDLNEKLAIALGNKFGQPTSTSTDAPTNTAQCNNCNGLNATLKNIVEVADCYNLPTIYNAALDDLKRKNFSDYESTDGFRESLPNEGKIQYATLPKVHNECAPVPKVPIECASVPKVPIECAPPVPKIPNDYVAVPKVPNEYAAVPKVSNECASVPKVTNECASVHKVPNKCGPMPRLKSKFVLLKPYKPRPKPLLKGPYKPLRIGGIRVKPLTSLSPNCTSGTQKSPKNASAENQLMKVIKKLMKQRWTL